MARAGPGEIPAGLAGGGGTEGGAAAGQPVAAGGPGQEGRGQHAHQHALHSHAAQPGKSTSPPHSVYRVLMFGTFSFTENVVFVKKIVGFHINFI